MATNTEILADLAISIPRIEKKIDALTAAVAKIQSSGYTAAQIAAELKKAGG